MAEPLITKQRPIWRIAVVMTSVLLVCLFVLYRGGAFRLADSKPAPLAAEAPIESEPESSSSQLFPSSKRGSIVEPYTVDGALNEYFFSSKSGVVIRADDLATDDQPDIAEESQPEP